MRCKSLKNKTIIKTILTASLNTLIPLGHAEEFAMMQSIGDLVYCKTEAALSKPFNTDDCAVLKFGWPVQVLETHESIAKVSIVRNILTYDDVEAFVRLDNLAPEGSQTKPEVMVSSLAFICPTAEAAVAYWKHSRSGEVLQAINVATDSNCKKILPEIAIGVYGQADPDVLEVSAFVQKGPIKTPVKGYIPRGVIR